MVSTRAVAEDLAVASGPESLDMEAAFPLEASP